MKEREHLDPSSSPVSPSKAALQPEQNPRNPRSLVSVIMIFFNAARFIEEAIQSVIAQSCERWELLLIDDGSTDGSAGIAQGYASRCPGKVCYLSHPSHQNRGMSASRNLGIEHARGEFIAFLDADDVWVSNILEDQLSILESHPEAAMVYGPIRYWYSWSGNPDDDQRDYVESPGVPANTLQNPPDLVSLFLEDKATVPSGMLVRREITKKVGGFEDSFHSLYEDQVFCAKICLAAPVYAAGECWYWYRQHPEASCFRAKAAGIDHAARHTFLNWLMDYLVAQRVSDDKVWQALNHELLPYHHPIRYRIRRAAHALKAFILQLVVAATRRVLPASVRRWLGSGWQFYRGVVPVGWTDFGSLRRLTPISREWGIERGTPIDRYYIEKFLRAEARVIQGHVLEILDDAYTRQFGGARVSHSDVLHIKAGNPKATLIADLTCADHLSSDTFDCIIITQTIHLIYDVRAAIWTLHRILKPGGTILLTVPGISQISRYDMDRWGDYWRFTTRSIRRLLEDYFPTDSVEVISYGNVLAATAFLYGLASNELNIDELDAHDPDYEALIAVRAVKPQNALEI